MPGGRSWWCNECFSDEDEREERPDMKKSSELKKIMREDKEKQQQHQQKQENGQEETVDNMNMSMSVPMFFIHENVLLNITALVCVRLVLHWRFEVDEGAAREDTGGVHAVCNQR